MIMSLNFYHNKRVARTDLKRVFSRIELKWKKQPWRHRKLLIFTEKFRPETHPPTLFIGYINKLIPLFSIHKIQIYSTFSKKKNTTVLVFPAQLHYTNLLIHCNSQKRINKLIFSPLNGRTSLWDMRSLHYLTYVKIQLRIWMKNTKNVPFGRRREMRGKFFIFTNLFARF